MKKYLFITLLMFTAFLVNGCTEYVSGLGKKDIKFVPKTQKFGDYTFVVPANFKLKEESSFIYENEGIVRAYLIYTGVGDKNKLIKFLTENLSKQGWKKTASLHGDVSILAFERGSQLLLIKIEKSLNLIIMKVMLTKK